MATPRIRVFLLRDTPHLETTDGKLIRLTATALDALIYVLLDDKDAHSLDDLNNGLYGGNQSRQQISSTARKTIRPNWRDAFEGILPDDFRKQVGKYTQRLETSYFEVDAELFENQVNEVLRAVKAGDADAADMIEVLNQYQSDFLNGYTYKLTYLQEEWHHDQQMTYATLRNRLMNRLLQYLVDNDHMLEAFKHAEAWYQSDLSSELPLQYLILTAYNLKRHTDYQQYLRVLQQHEKRIQDDPAYPVENAVLNPELGFGFTAEQWRNRINNEPYKIFPWVLTGNMPDNNTHLSQLHQGAIVGRDEIIRDIISALSVMNRTQAVVVTGQPGVGKSTVANIAAESLLHGHRQVLIRAEITRDTHFEQLVQHIVSEMLTAEQTPPLPHERLDHFTNAMQSGKYVLVLDEWEPAPDTWAQLLPHLLPLLGSSRLIMAREEAPPHSQIYDVPIEPLQQEETSSIFKNASGEWELAEQPERTFDQLQRVTGGIPALTVLLARLIHEDCMSARMIANLLNTHSADMHDGMATNARYAFLWRDIWEHLPPHLQRVLRQLSLFDDYQGAPAHHLKALSEHPGDRLTQALEQLETLTLVTCHEKDQQQWYQLLPSLRCFIRDAVPPAADDTPALYNAFAAYYYDELCAQDNPNIWIANHYRNVLRAFNQWVADETSIRPTLPTDLAPLYNYLKRTGNYTTAANYLERLAAVTTFPPRETAYLRHQQGKIAVELGNLDAAHEHLEKAIGRAESNNLMDIYSAALYDAARVHVQQDDFEQAKKKLNEAQDNADPDTMAPLRCRIFIMHAELAEKQAQFDDAQRYYNQAREVAQSPAIDDKHHSADLVEKVLNGLGKLAMTELNYPAALDHFNDAMYYTDTYNLGSDRKFLSYLNLGTAQFHLGNLQRSTEFYNQAHIIASSTGNLPKLIHIQWNRASNHIVSGESAYHLAERTLHQNLQLATERGYTRLEAGNRITLGALHLRRHQYELATRFFSDAYTQTTHTRELNTYALYGFALTVIVKQYLAQFPSADTVTDDLRMLFANHNIDLPDSKLIHHTIERAHSLFSQLIATLGDLDAYHVRTALHDLAAGDSTVFRNRVS